VGGPGLTGVSNSGCDFDETVSGNTASLGSGTPSCSVTDSSTGEVDYYTFETLTWVLSTDGTTAQVSETAFYSTALDGESWSCQATWSDTATLQ
jgi:hypothetical protein